MKYFIALYLAIFITSSHALTYKPDTSDEIQVPAKTAEEQILERSIAIAEKLNIIGQDVAICQAYYMHIGHADNAEKFDAHGKFIRDYAMDFFATMGISIEGDPSTVYYNNVYFAKENMHKLEPELAADLANECVELDEQINNLNI